MEIKLSPIAWVRNTRKSPIDDQWGEIHSEIELDPTIPDEAIAGLSAFSHLEIIYYFDQVKDSDIVYAGHPRGNPNYPKVGIFGQRKKDRPNQLGLCTVNLLAVKERKLVVANLDAINGTPVLDIKPVFRQFQAKGEIAQPEWVDDLMKNYF